MLARELSLDKLRRRQFPGQIKKGAGAPFVHASLEAAAPQGRAYFLRNLSTRPPVSTIFCLPV
jgi:hypothetical protein